MISNYVELRVSSAFSFLEAASQPEELVMRACDLGYKALALSDLGGVYGVPRFWKAAKEAGIRPIVGAVVPLELQVLGKTFVSYVLLLCENRKGWQNLCEVLTEAHWERPKGECLATLDLLSRLNEGLVAVAGGKNGPILQAARLVGKDGAEHTAKLLLRVFTQNNLFVDIQRHGEPSEEHQNRFLLDLCHSLRIPCIATNDVRYHIPQRAKILDCFLALRLHKTLDDAGQILPPHHRYYLEKPEEMVKRFSDLPDILRNTCELAERLTFDLSATGYSFPRFPVPEGETEFSMLYRLVQEGVQERYKPVTPRVMQQITHELNVIAKLELAGYFLLVWDIARFCKEHGILAQGRGSAANSAVCYALGITAVDPIGYDLLFERFLSEERGEWPDIDLDLPSGEARERVIQYVYQRYGERSVGMTASVITYRGRLAVREIGKVMGLDPTSLDRLARLIGHYEYPDNDEEIAVRAREAGLSTADPRVARCLEIWSEVRDLPRHISQHNGGLVIAGGRLDRVVPLEPARMPGRRVIQWDKDDLADLRMIKVDLLGLGMLAAIHETIELVRTHEGIEIDLAHLPKEDKQVFDMLCKADTVGVFQVESRAQMAILPRMRPTRFYDLVVEVAIVRPGPIVGQMVNPYLERRQGRAPVRYAHPLLEPILRRTLGVPIFQEQIMRMAMAVAGFSGGQAEELRRAMGSRRSKERMARLVGKLREGMTRNNIPEASQEEIVNSITNFALYGFPESHAASFALIAYASAWLKVHHPAAFYTALLNQWPLGFYHPSTLIRDAQRHGIEVRPIDVNHSLWECSIEKAEDGRMAVRVGLKYVKGLSQATGTKIVSERQEGPYIGVLDLSRRTNASKAEVLALCEAGAVGDSRRDAMWQAMLVGGEPALLIGAYSEHKEPGLADMAPFEACARDYATTGISTGPHPMALLRKALDQRGFIKAGDLSRFTDGAWVKVAGMVIVRQRPGTAKGMYFATLEDETGFANIVVKPNIFLTNRSILTLAPFLGVCGVLQKRDGVISVLGKRFYPLRISLNVESRNFC